MFINCTTRFSMKYKIVRLPAPRPAVNPVTNNIHVANRNSDDVTVINGVTLVTVGLTLPVSLQPDANTKAWTVTRDGVTTFSDWAVGKYFNTCLFLILQ